MEWNELIVTGIKSIIQLIVLGIAGGWISRFYSTLQKNREIKINLIKEVARIQGQFLAIRYEFNTFHLNWGKDEIKKIAREIEDEELKKLKWKYYEEACNLIGEYQGIKSLLIEFFPEEENQVNYLHTKYQDWRRSVRDDKPIFQNADGKTHQTLNEIKSNFKRMIVGMRKEI